MKRKEREEIQTKPISSVQQEARKAIVANPRDLDEIWVHGRCADGLGSAVVGALFYEDQKNFGRPIPLKVWFVNADAMNLPSGKDKKIAIFDFCPSVEQISTLVNECVSLTIHDHHVSNKTKLEAFPAYCTYSEVNSGIGLAWKFFYGLEKTPHSAFHA